MAGKTQVPEGWQLVQLGGVAEVVMGQSPPSTTVFDWDDQHSSNTGLPFIQGNAEFNDRFPQPVKWCIEPLKIARQGDALISVRAPVGETNRANCLLAIGRGLAAIRFIVADSSFGWHILNHAKQSFERVTQGSTFKAIGGKEVRSLPILLPPMAEQRAIAAVLDSIDEAIEGAEAVIAAAERLRDALLHELLTRGIPGRHTEWRDAPGVGTIPADWEVARLGDVAEVNRDSWDPVEGSPILYLDLTAVVAPGILSSPKEVAAKDAPSRARRQVQSGDVLVSTVRPYLRGFARVRHAPDNLVASTGFAVLTPSGGVNGSYVYHHVMTPGFARHLEGAMTGQAYPAVRPDDVASYRFGLPPLPEQQAIAATLDGVDEAIEGNRVERDRLQLLKASASDALLTGRVRVGRA